MKKATGRTQLASTPRRRCAEKLHALVDGRRLLPVFQPIVDLSHGDIAGIEALVRPAPGSGFADASALFRAAERSELLWDVERVARSASMHALAQWKGGSHVLLFINCSPAVFVDDRFCAHVQDEVRAAGLEPARVVLEITERSDQQYSPAMTQRAGELKAAGFQVAIDDVGAGASGLTRIMGIRPHWLKLDRELVANIDRDAVRQNLMRFFVEFARLSGVRVVAEGIERPEELTTLIQLGVPMGQGFLLARPGARDQQLTPELARHVRDAWIEVENRSSAAMNVSVGLLRECAVSAPAVHAELPTADAARICDRSPDAAGIAAIIDDRVIGWIDRDQLAHAAARSPTRAVGFLARPLATLPPSAPVAAALELVAARSSHAMGDPILLAHALRQGSVSIVLIPDLLRSAADLTQEPARPATLAA